MQAFARIGLEKGPAVLLVMPRLESVAWLHRRKYMHQTGSGAPLGKDGSHARFLAKALFADEFDLQSVVSGHGFRVPSKSLPKLLGPVRIVKDTGTGAVEETCGGPCVANIDQAAGDDYPVIARKLKGNLVGVSFGEMYHAENIDLEST